MDKPLRYGDPTPDQERIMRSPVTVFQVNEVPPSQVRLHVDCLQDPLSMRQQAQDSVVTASLCKPRGVDLEADVDLLKAFMGLVVYTVGGAPSSRALAGLGEVLDQSSTIILKEKFRHNYPRPAQVVEAMLGYRMPTNMDSVSAHTPAYPSGHSAQAALLALILSEAFPHRSVVFSAIADTIGLGRVLAGLHTPEDHSYGQDIGAFLFQALRPEVVAELVAALRQK